MPVTLVIRLTSTRPARGRHGHATTREVPRRVASHLRSCQLQIPGLTDSQFVQFANADRIRSNPFSLRISANCESEPQARQSIAGRFAQEALRILVGFARIRSVCESVRIANRQPRQIPIPSLIAPFMAQQPMTAILVGQRARSWFCSS